MPKQYADYSNLLKNLPKSFYVFNFLFLFQNRYQTLLFLLSNRHSVTHPSYIYLNFFHSLKAPGGGGQISIYSPMFLSRGICQNRKRFAPMFTLILKITSLPSSFIDIINVSPICIFLNYCCDYLRILVPHKEGSLGVVQKRLSCYTFICIQTIKQSYKKQINTLT